MLLTRENGEDIQIAHEDHDGVHCSIGSRCCWSTTIKPQADTTKNTKETCSFSFCQHGQSVCKGCYLRHQMSSKEAQSSIKCLCESDKHCFSPGTYTPLPSNTPLHHQLEMTTAAAQDESHTFLSHLENPCHHQIDT